MVTQTDALAAFRTNIKRPRALLEMFDAGTLKPKKGDRRTVGKPGWQENELLRAAVITAIGALDAYLSDVAAEVLIAQLERAATPTGDARAVLRQVMKEIDTLPMELALLTDQAERRRVAEEAVREHLANRVSNHGAKGVAATLGRMGRTMNWDALRDRLDDHLALTTDKRTPPALLDAWTIRRHKLVHQGVALKIKSPQARALVDFVEAVAEVVDETAADCKTAESAAVP